ncbi:MAG: Holliday junction resolvase RuvX [Oscillospiraceae bacterium]|nr:Holliday junction resolvase RuvX [Oscillospiraceae bacterium]
MKKRIMGIDYGDSRVGVAVNDLLGLTAQGVKTIPNRGIKKLLADMQAVIGEYKPERIVIGLPKNMDGSSGFRVDETKEFAEALKEIYDGEIVFWDERLSTVAAHNILNETNTRGKKRRQVVDTVAAAVILDGYMRANGNIVSG